MPHLNEGERDVTTDLFGALRARGVAVMTQPSPIFLVPEDEGNTVKKVEKATFGSIAEAVEAVERVNGFVYLYIAIAHPAEHFAGAKEHVSVKWLVEGRSIVEKIADLEEDPEIDFRVLPDDMGAKCSVLQKMRNLRAQTQEEKRFLNGVMDNLSELAKHRRYREALKDYLGNVR